MLRHLEQAWQHLQQAFHHLAAAFAISSAQFWTLLFVGIGIVYWCWVTRRGVENWLAAFREETWFGRLVLVIVGLFGIMFLFLLASLLPDLFSRAFS